MRHAFGLPTFVTILTLAAQATAATPEQICQASKNLTAGKLAACLAKAEKVFVITADSVKYAASTAKCHEKYELQWAAHEAKAGPGVCPSEGDVSLVQDAVLTCSSGIAEAVSVTGPAAGCGNGESELFEECDDGNLDNGDACNPTCTLANTVSTFAGQPGAPGTADGSGAAAQLGTSGSLVSDGTYLYVADTTNHRIRRIEIATAAVTTIAGSTSGHADNATGTSARFTSPDGIATDGTTLWVTDTGNNVIRAIDLTPPHAVTTVAGTAGMAGATDGVGAAARFDSPRGLVFHDGLLYLVDPVAFTLRSFDPASGTVTTLAGSAYMSGLVDGTGASARFVSPRFTASDGAQYVYVSDTNGASIRRFEVATGEVTTLIGDGSTGYSDGTGAAIHLHRPRGVAVGHGGVYWVESEQDTVRQYVFATDTATTLAGQHCSGGPCPGGYEDGVGTSTLFDFPFGMALDESSSSLFVFDANAVIRRIQ